MGIQWQYKHFTALTTEELYSIIRLRIEVFCVEQQCIYQDLDDKDQDAYHLCGWINGHLVAYCRLLAPGVSYAHPSIGRVLSSPQYRRDGYGRQLMQQAIQLCRQQFNDDVIIISAQFYLLQFYTSLGFVQVSDPYLEDDIPHIKMQLG